MKECPRCHRNCLEDEGVLNSISHIGDRIEICSKCGQEQGLVGMEVSNNMVEIAMEERFKKELGL